MSNAKIDDKKIFKIKPSNIGIDATISGEVLESSFDFRLYYDDAGVSKCVKYAVVSGKKTGECIEYRQRRIPCERRDYRVKTQVKVLNIKHEVIFSKVYTKSDFTNECYKYNRPYMGFMLYNNYYYEKEKKRFNTKLAQEVAKEIVKDLSPHYIYQKVPIMEELEDNFDKTKKEEFENIIQLLEKNQIIQAQRRLLFFDRNTKLKSYKVFYNLAITFESQDDSFMAKSYLQKAKMLCKDSDDMELILKAINRIKRADLMKEKAKAQIDKI